MEAIGRFFGKVWEILLIIWAYVSKMYKVFLAAPVVYGAVVLALQNMTRLPKTVGLDLQIDGTFAVHLSRELAVLGPLALTALCLLFMFCSRRVVYPWLISIFSLVLPELIWLTNVFPS
jgi:hypothetical protein